MISNFNFDLIIVGINVGAALLWIPLGFRPLLNKIKSLVKLSAVNPGRDSIQLRSLAYRLIALHTIFSFAYVLLLAAVLYRSRQMGIAFEDWADSLGGVLVGFASVCVQYLILSIGSSTLCDKFTRKIVSQAPKSAKRRMKKALHSTSEAGPFEQQSALANKVAEITTANRIESQIIDAIRRSDD